jgi:SAM-dependent methyltransferase
VWERVWKRAVRGMPALLRHYLRGLALLIKRPKLAQELQDREQRLKELKSRLAKERREARRLKKELKLHPPVGEARFGDLRRLRPIGRNFGFNRGRPVDRYYIENFLARQAEDIRGRVLEIANASYTRRYGGSRVKIIDVLDVAEDNPQATIVADLTHAEHVPSDAFDCVILTQTLHLIYDVRSAIRTLHRTLKPGGVLLATFPGISQIGCRGCSDHWCWAFTQLSARRLFEEAFPAQNVELEAHGNVLAAISFLHGLVVEELRQEELDYHDPDYEVLITLRAVKPEARP